MTGHAPPPSRWFVIGRLVLRAVVRADRRAAVEGDLIELWHTRQTAGRRDLGRAYLADLAGIVRSRGRVPAAFTGQPRHPRSIAEGMRSVHRDVLYALRLMRRQPLFTVVGFVTLVLGIAASTAIFTAVDRLILRPLPYPEPDRLMHVTNAPLTWEGRAMLSARFTSLEVFAGAGVYATGGANLDGTPAVRVAAAAADDGFFAAIGVAPLLGQPLPAGLGNTEPRFAMVGYDLWRRQFGGDIGLPGRTIRLNGLTYNVAGVMPSGFTFPGRTEVWVQPRADFQLTGAAFAPDVVARLAPGVDVARARAALDVYNAAAAARAPAGADRQPTTIEPLVLKVSARIRPTLILLAVSVALLLMVVAANVANLMLARVAVREREFVVRRALGASRWRVTRQLLIESLLLAGAAGAAGMLLAGWVLRALGVLSPDVLGDLGLDTVDPRLLIAAAAMSIGTGLIFGLAPGFAAGAVPASRMVRAGRDGTESPFWRRFRGALVIVQMASVLVLLTASVATVRTLARTANIDLGFTGSQALGFQVTLPMATYDSVASWIGFFDRAHERLAAVPGIRRVAATGLLPGSREMGVGLSVAAADRPANPGGTPYFASYLSASPDYFSIMGVPIVAGRPFLPADRTGAPGVAILSASAARALFPDGTPPVGQRIVVGRPRPGQTPEPLEIVGVVADVRVRGPQASPRDLQQVYVSLLQSPPFGSLSFVLEADGDPAAATPAVRAALRDIDTTIPIYDVAVMSRVVDRFLAAERLAMTLVGSFALVTLVVAAVGLYGLMAQVVAARRREIGIRVALGADPARLRRRIVSQGAVVALAGSTIGIAGAVGTLRVFASLLPGFESLDAGVLALNAAALVAVAIVASWAPARRAAAIDPVATLRE